MKGKERDHSPWFLNIRYENQLRLLPQVSYDGTVFLIKCDFRQLFFVCVFKSRREGCRWKGDGNTFTGGW